jgi:hypothetical protein
MGAKYSSLKVETGVEVLVKEERPPEGCRQWFPIQCSSDGELLSLYFDVFDLSLYAPKKYQGYI